MKLVRSAMKVKWVMPNELAVETKGRERMSETPFPQVTWINALLVNTLSISAGLMWLINPGVNPDFWKPKHYSNDLIALQIPFLPRDVFRKLRLFAVGVTEENEFREELILREKICNHQASFKKSSDGWDYQYSAFSLCN